MPVMEQAVQDSACDDLRLREDFRPGFEASVRRQDDRTLLVEAGDRLEEEVRAGFVQLEVAEFIQDEEVQARQLDHFSGMHPGKERLDELVHELGDGIE